ncbi:hypothetical protein DL765_006634 [Monosporascus sp. GIB2]|nr:hypothetical protein DL765_006634 [Monosporascus sp. GIB2]
MDTSTALSTGLEVVERGGNGGDGHYSEFLEERIGKFLPPAFAVLDLEAVFGEEARRQFYGNLRSPVDAPAEDIIAFVDAHLPEQTLGAIVRKRHLSPDDVAKIAAFHDIVNYYTRTISESARANLPGPKSYSKHCSKTETDRFTKSLYVFHLASCLFPRDEQKNPATAERAEDLAPPGVTSGPSLHRGSYSRRAALTSYSLSISTKRALESSFGTYDRFVVNWGRTEPWYIQHDTLYLKQKDELTHLDVTEVLKKYQETDPGPQNSWMHTLLQSHIDDGVLRDDSRLFQCDQHASRWGYPFWDRKTLDDIANNSLPTTAEMVPESDVHVFTDNVKIYTGCRYAAHICTCKSSEW